MARAPSTFRERDLAAALRAAKKAGVPVRIKIRKGEIEVIPGEPEPEPTQPAEPDAASDEQAISEAIDRYAQKVQKHVPHRSR